MACGDDHALALTTDGSLWAWGRNQYGELGQNNTTQLYTPTRIGSLTGWTAISAGSQHSAALRSDGTVWTWGYNWKSALGLGDATDRWVPTQVNLNMQPPADTTAPTTAAAVTPVCNAAGWKNTKPVTVSFTATDGGSGVAYTEWSTDAGASWTRGASCAVTAEGTTTVQ